jgi:hypothetical protein
VTERDPALDDRDDALPDDLRAAFDAVKARHQRDPSAAVLRAAGATALPAPEQDVVSGQLASSRWSQAVVRGADAATSESTLDEESVERLLARVHRDAADRPVSPAAPPRARSRFFYPAIGIAAAALIGVTVVMQRRAPSPITPEPAAVAPAASPSAFHMPIDAPAIKLTSRALVLRSQGTASTFVDQIAPAIDAYRAGKYHDAAAAFAALAPRFPKSVEVAFYRGASQLLDGDAPGAVASLNTAAALDDATFNDDIAWYLAAAEERAGDVTSARSGLTALCHGSSPYAPRACDAAAKLPR